MRPQYSMWIQWSEEDRVYIVELPEFPGCHTHGSTYEEAARHGEEVLETLIEMYEDENRPLPKPQMGSPASASARQRKRRKRVQRAKAAT